MKNSVCIHTVEEKLLTNLIIQNEDLPGVYPVVNFDAARSSGFHGIIMESQPTWTDTPLDFFKIRESVTATIHCTIQWNVE